MKYDTPFVSREEYYLAVQNALDADPYDPDYHNGMRNPYSFYEVTCEDDYNEYMREYVYYRLCEEFLGQQYDTKLSIRSQQFEDEFQNKINRFKQKYDDSVSMIGRLLFIASVILVLLLAFMAFWYIPEKEAVQYDDGYTSGYKHGYVRGYADALLDDSNSASRDASVDVTIPRAGIGYNRTVYVSHNNKMHLNSRCSGMVYYSKMNYGDACVAGYAHCSKCF